MSTIRIEFHIPSSILASLHCEPEQFSRELRLAVAVKWYELGTISQGRAAEIAGVSRAAFIEALGRFGVSPFQVDPAELASEVLNG